MFFFDIHSHILPAVDDGAANLDESLRLLEMMRAQGIGAVIATPHFYPQEDNLSDFTKKTVAAFSQLKSQVSKRKLPNIYLGCEMLYFKGIGSSESLEHLCLNGSDYLLLELTDEAINDELFEDICNMRKNLGITPIIAHIERYYRAKKYRKLLRFVLKEKIPAQINSSSVLMPSMKRIVKKLIKSGVAYTLATDSHSVDKRPPLLVPALNLIRDKYGENYKKRMIENSKKLYKSIILNGN